MNLSKATEKKRFLSILSLAEYELNDGVEIPGVHRTFSVTEYAYIDAICRYIKKMVEYFDEHGQLVKEEYDAEDPKVRHERKKGKWEEGYFQNGIYAPKCSCCGENQYAAVTIDIKGNVHKMAYCPNCGADMRGEENETD